MLAVNSSPSELSFTVPRPKPTIRIKKLTFRNGPQILRRVADSQPWSTQYLIDEITISLLDTKAVFCMLDGLTRDVRMQDIKNLGRGVIRRLYEAQARYKMYRMSIFQPPPTFVVYLKHLDDRVKQELKSLDRETKDFVMREAIGRIFEQVDSRYFLLSVKPLLRWRFEN